MTKNNLKKFRLQKGLSLEDLGRLINKSRQYVYYIESNRAPLPDKYAKIFADYFNVTIDEIYGTQVIRNATDIVMTFHNMIDYFKNNPQLLENDKGKDDNDFYCDRLNQKLFNLLSKMSDMIEDLDYSFIELFIDTQKFKKTECKQYELHKSGVLGYDFPMPQNLEQKAKNYNYQIDQLIEMLNNHKLK